jgi:mono/diheme cytochrome c family protein
MKRLLTVIAGLAVVGVLGFFALAWWPAIAPISPSPPGSFAPDLVAHGEALSGGGFCAVCHTAKGGRTYAGGYPMQTPFGIIYSTNITPDPETGIGTWSEAAFTRAMHEGVARDGSHLFPAFPYDYFTKLSDNDVKALYAYFMTRPPVRSPAKGNTIPFPLNIRYLQRGGGNCWSSGLVATSPMPQRAPNGTAAPTSRSDSAIAAPATLRANLPPHTFGQWVFSRTINVAGETHLKGGFNCAQVLANVAKDGFHHWPELESDFAPATRPVRPSPLPPDFPDLAQNPSSELQPAPDLSATPDKVAGTIPVAAELAP